MLPLSNTCTEKTAHCDILIQLESIQIHNVLSLEGSSSPASFLTPFVNYCFSIPDKYTEIQN